MPVKKIGSKLAQGVRQVKAQQVSALVEALETRMPSPDTAAPSVPSITKPAAARAAKPAAPAIDKPVPVKGVLKPAPIDVHPSGIVHPSRVWPD